VKRIAKLMLPILAIAFVLAANQSQNRSSASLCELLTPVMKDYERIKPGLSREQLEKFLRRDGGLQFRSATRYVFPACNLLRVDVEFTLNGEPARLFAPDDVVEEISKIYVEYPAKD